MAVTIRLARHGKKSQPHYFIIVQDKEKHPQGGFIEKIGYYKPYTNPVTLVIEQEKATQWIKQGAKPSARVGKLLQIMADGGPKLKVKKTKKFGDKFSAVAKPAKPAEAAAPAEPKAETPAAEQTAAPAAKEPEKAKNK
jgi:small subunit ribosomal protein S16